MEGWESHTQAMDTECLQRLVDEVALKELGEDEHTREQALTQMRSWVLTNPNLMNCRTDDSFLLRFLRAKKYDRTQAQKMVVDFLNLRNVLPLSVVGNLDVSTPLLEDLVKSGFYSVSPNRDDKGRRVILIILKRIDPKMYDYKDAARIIMLSNFTLMEETDSQVLGYTYIFDASEMSIGHIGMWPSPFEFIRFLKSGEAAIPMRNKEIHILNMPFFANWMFYILKNALTKKLRDRIKVHSSLKSLHSHVNPDVLPQEYGGSTSMEKIIELWKAELLAKRDVIVGLDDMEVLSDKEVNRRKDIENISTIEQTFHTLEID